MRNFKSFSNFVSLIRSKLSTTTMLYYSCRQNYSPTVITRSLGTCSTIARSDSLFVGQNKVPVINVFPSRNLSMSSALCAKSKDRGGKDKKKPKAGKIDMREMSELLDADKLTDDMQQCIEHMKNDFIKNLSLRSTTGALEQIPIKMGDKVYQLQELAQISRKAKLIVLNIAAFPTSIPLIIQAIEKSGLNINPQQDGTTLFLAIPKVTKEHRENLSKNAKALFIKYRDEIKDVRNKAVKTLKKKDDVSEDLIRRVIAQVEALCDKHVKEAETILHNKQNELLGAAD